MSAYRAAKFPDAIFYFFPFSLVMYCSGDLKNHHHHHHNHHRHLQEEHPAWKPIMWVCSILASEPCSCRASYSAWVFLLASQNNHHPSASIAQRKTLPEYLPHIKVWVKQSSNFALWPNSKSKITKMILIKVGVWSVLTNMTPHEDKREKRVQDNQTLGQVCNLNMVPPTFICTFFSWDIVTHWD